MKTLTVRNLPPEVAEALKREKALRGGSLNQTVIDILARSLGVSARRSNGLLRFSGRWTEEQFADFADAVRGFSQVDPELWDE